MLSFLRLFNEIIRTESFTNFLWMTGFALCVRRADDGILRSTIKTKIRKVSRLLW
jgi:hypothetical protein